MQDNADKKIAFVVPYYGKFPDYFPLWLKTCGTNPTIDFLLFTDENMMRGGGV